LRGLVVAAIILSASAAIAEVEDDLRDGDKYFEQSDWKKAAAAYDRAIGKSPGQVSAEAYGKRAAIYIIQNDVKGGLDFVARAKQHYPSAPEIGEQEALLLWESGKRDEAIAIAETVVKTRPQSFSNQQIIGEYYAARDPAKTTAAFEAYLAHRPAELEGGDALPRLRLGFAYLATARSAIAESDDAHAQQLYSKAVEQFEYVARKLGKKPNATVNADNGLCAAYTGLGRWDQALTVCERIAQNPTQIDSTGSVYFNLATAYLANRQTKKARTAALEFAARRKTEARGLLLVGDTYFAENDWQHALDQYLHAEKLLKPSQARDQVQLSIRLGKTYRRLPANGTQNLALAIDKLSTAWNANPNSLELALELGAAYLEAQQDAKATQLTDKVLAAPELGKAPADQHAAILVLAGKALFNQHKLKEARARFESAQQLKANDVQIQRALIETINSQGIEVAAKDPKAAQVLLEQALGIDASSPITLTNIAVLAIDRGDCDTAQRELVRLGSVRGSDAVLTARLLGRSFLCGTRPDPKRAAEAFASAEREAKKANAQLSLAEIYTEWAPLTWDADLAGSVEKLEQAVQIASQDPEVAPAAKRNLALALYRRGWKNLHDNKAQEAATDFERATRDPSVLKGSEPLAFDFSYAIALLDSGRGDQAAKLFKSLATRGNQGAYLKAPYAKIGAQYWAAYANYRTASGPARAAACDELAKLEGDLGSRVRDLIASCWETAAVDAARIGQLGAAQKDLATADKTATADQKRRIALDRIALSLDKTKLGELEAFGGEPPEALVDLGIVYDLLGRPKDAYDTWVKARAKNAQAPNLQKWIDAKKRIYGF
jgi:lipopolysaccharide biosynthesis regulator YciM